MTARLHFEMTRPSMTVRNRAGGSCYFPGAVSRTMRRLATQLVPPQRGNRSDQGYLKLSISPKVSTGDRWFESISLHRGVRNEPVPQRPQNYGAKRFTS